MSEPPGGGASYDDGVDKPGFIVPPPNLIPPRVETDSQTHRSPGRTSALPPFRPPVATGAQAPIATPDRRWQITLPTAVVIIVDEAVLLGRNPVAIQPWPNAELVVVNDPAKTVSKTHAAVHADGDVLRVTDLHSTNGVTIVTPDGIEHPCDAGVAAAVAQGSTVYLGQYAIRVDRA